MYNSTHIILPQPRPLARGTVANAPYETRPPSPPCIHVPTVADSMVLGPEGVVVRSSPETRGGPAQSSGSGSGSGSDSGSHGYDADASHDGHDHDNHSWPGMTIVPSYADADPTELTEEDLRIITQDGRSQVARDTTLSWKYESRREAQAILDFLYLGPSSVVKDAAFLQREGITMLLGARDSRMAEARLMSVERTARALGIVADYIDVTGHQELIRAFPVAVKKINDHLLSVYRSQIVPVSADDHQNSSGGSGGGGGVEGGPSSPVVAIDSSRFRRGRVLVFCETGNDRSAAVVAAYIMAVFGMGMIRTLQFVGLQRFCTNFDEETKRWLRSYDDLLQARRAVARARDQFALAGGLGGIAGPRSSLSSPGKRGRGQQGQQGQQQQQQQPRWTVLAYRGPAKRSIEDTMEDEDERMEGGGGGGGGGLLTSSSSPAGSAADFNLDMDRYVDRPAFTPFADGGGPMAMD